jgi:hypothetical protein
MEIMFILQRGGTDVSWDQVFMFGKAFGILLALSAIFYFFNKLYLLATSATERKALKYETPYRFIGSDFIYQANKNYRYSGSKDKNRDSDCTTCYTFTVTNIDNTQPSFDISIDYRDIDIKLEVVLIADKFTETKTFNCEYDKDSARSLILKAMDILLSSYAEHKKR